MSDLGRIMAQEPEPHISIPCRKVPVPGLPGQFQLQPSLTFTNMPGGWDTVHHVLCTLLSIVAQEMVKEVAGEKKVELIPMLPDGNSLIRQ